MLWFVCCYAHASYFIFGGNIGRGIRKLVKKEKRMEVAIKKFSDLRNIAMLKIY